MTAARGHEFLICSTRVRNSCLRPSRTAVSRPWGQTLFTVFSLCSGSKPVVSFHDLPPRNPVSMRTHSPSRRNSNRVCHQTRGRVDVVSIATCKCPRNTGRSSPLDAATTRVVYKPSVPVAAKPTRCAAQNEPARRRMKPGHEVPAAMDGGRLTAAGVTDGTGDRETRMRAEGMNRCAPNNVPIQWIRCAPSDEQSSRGPRLRSSPRFPAAPDGDRKQRK